MSSTMSSEWFEDSFDKLDPLLRQLHLQGGELAGPVKIKIGTGLAGFFAKRIAKKLGVPVNKGEHRLKVNISHQADGLHWDRCFDESTLFRSVFLPVGNKSNGYWVETTGTIKIFLTVDIREGGWHWCCMRVKIKGITIPLWLFPKTTAYKKIENGCYRFYVGIALPLLGEVISYSGLLEANLNSAS